MNIVNPPGAVSIMAVAAHPDDIESWCAGTLTLAIAQGARVHLLLVTSGEHGSSDPLAQPQTIATLREQEARAAAQQLGLADVTFLRYPDGNVENTNELRRDIVEWIRRWQPFALFTHDPEQPYPPYLSHRDHRIVGRAALDAVYPLARNHLTWPELALPTHTVAQVWLFASRSPNAYVDIAGGFERKLTARLEHHSQTPDPLALAAGWRTRAANIGAPAGLTAAEAFVVLEEGG